MTGARADDGATAGVTPSQNLGPFFSLELLRSAINVVAPADVAGRRIRLDGRLVDGEGRPVLDGLVEIWQADAQGRYLHPRVWGRAPRTSFVGFGRSGTVDDGHFWFETVMPGRTEEDRSPHLNVAVSARGLVHRGLTRVYFEDVPPTEADLFFAAVPGPRRATLIARRVDADRYEWDVVMRGPRETVFFSI